MRTRLMSVSLLTLILLALLFVDARSAFGQTINPQALYRIMAKHSGKCLDVTGGNIGNGARVLQWDCHGRENQQWTFTPVGDGYYKIIAKHSGRGLDVFGGIFSTGNGVIVEQWDYNGRANQMWRVDYIGDGYYTIIARHSGKSLDIFGASTDNGAQAHQWDYVGGDNQKWRLTELPGRPTTEPPIRPACAGADSLTSAFAGTVNMRIADERTPDSFSQNINLPINFTVCRTNVRIADFPAIAVTFDTGWLGQNTTTVTHTGGGTGVFNPDNGSMNIPLTLRFQHSLENRLGAFAGPSTLTLNLTTEGSGGQRVRGGEVTLVGSERFIGGFLNNTQSNFTINGRLSPSP